MPRRSAPASTGGQNDGPSAPRLGPPRWRRLAKYAALFAVLVAIVIAPFLLFEDTIDRISGMLESTASRSLTAVAGFLLLAADVVLPVPSTVVITLLGSVMGILAGTLVAAAGLTLGCVFGFWLGRTLGRPFAERSMGAGDFAYLSRQLDCHGVLILALCRPVPVLAEASVIAAGVTGMATGRVLAVTTLANIGVAAAYALPGATANTNAGFLLAVAASTALPLAGILIARALRRQD